ncbi:hypothetical protein BaRGS_00002914 [Batillaria attramentaria]|uniref:Uncharacterized protein n=1 Tax=Batillaria attramentaria TaxID=370345 RepID=A0ABD0M1T0_9CAEN
MLRRMPHVTAKCPMSPRMSRVTTNVPCHHERPMSPECPMSPGMLCVTNTETDTCLKLALVRGVMFPDGSSSWKTVIKSGVYPREDLYLETLYQICLKTRWVELVLS